MPEVTIVGDTYTITNAEYAAFQELVAQGVDDLTAVRIATETWVDINPDAPKEDQP